MYEAIKNFNQQFAYQPKVIGELKKYKKFVVVGMGGSNLAAELIKIWNPGLDINVHRDYGLPILSGIDAKQSLIICNSYSGNTEEVLDAFAQARSRNLPLAVISTGGKLLEQAKKNAVPYIQMPETGIQPRSSVGFNVLATLKAIGEEGGLKEAAKLAALLKPSDYEEGGKTLAKKLKNFVPLVYSSVRNFGVAYNWKIRLNETAKIPAFANCFPEVNHNEMVGFDGLSKNFRFVFLRDAEDQPRILKRMEVMKKLMEDRKYEVEVLPLSGKTLWLKIFSSIVLADWTAYYLAKAYKADPERVEMVEEFKRLI